MPRWPNGSATQPRVSSAFGPRTSPTAGASSFHRGCDFVGFDQVRAVASGRVVVTGTPSGWSGGGRQVWIQHDGFFSRSAHLASWAVKPGQWVNEGDIIGAMDTTGTATGKHVHLEITLGTLHYSNSGQIDPVAFIAARLTGNSNYTPARDKYGAAHVTEGQQGLIALGYELGSAGADGWDGPATQGAVRDFQSKNGLTVDGILGPNTLAKIRERLAAGTVGRNTTDRPTADVQRLVGANPDGVYGPDTTAKVKTWQAANGLHPDGVWGPLSDAKGFPDVTDAALLAIDGDLGELTVKALQRSLGFTGDDVDGILGPITIAALQRVLGVADDGQLGPITIKALQAALGVAVDGDLGELTVKALQSALNHGKTLAPTPTPEPDAPTGPQPGRTEADATPHLVTPTAADFPAWIRYEEVLDEQYLADPEWNLHAEQYYGEPYNPVEAHLHWWGEPGNAGTHDSNVRELATRAKDLGANYVTSAGRVTLLTPLDKIALTTGRRNPRGWKSENDPALTELGYKTLGFLHYKVEELNPHLAGEPFRLHKEFQNTSCSGIDVAKVRAYADAFASGDLDPATGEKPVDPEPPAPEPTQPEPDPETPEEEPMPEQPQPARMTDEEAETLKGRVHDALNVIPEVVVADGALGAIVSDPGKRRRIYSAYTIIGLVLRALGAGVGAAVASAFAIWAAIALIVSEQAHAALDPWMPLIVTLVAVFAFLSGAYGSLSSQVSLLARANTPPANQIE